MNKDKLVCQLFIGKVTDVLGLDKTTELLKEAKDAINEINQGQELPINNVSGSYPEWYDNGFKDGLAHRTLKCKCGKN